MSYKDEAKKRNVLIHSKYNRRLIRLSFLIQEFLKVADMKLDKSLSGNIKNREQIEQIEKKCRELAALIPDPKRPPIVKKYFDVFQQIPGVTEGLIPANDLINGLEKVSGRK